MNEETRAYVEAIVTKAVSTKVADICQTILRTLETAALEVEPEPAPHGGLKLRWSQQALPVGTAAVPSMDDDQAEPLSEEYQAFLQEERFHTTPEWRDLIVHDFLPWYMQFDGFSFTTPTVYDWVAGNVYEQLTSLDLEWKGKNKERYKPLIGDALGSLVKAGILHCGHHQRTYTVMYRSHEDIVKVYEHTFGGSGVWPRP